MRRNRRIALVGAALLTLTAGVAPAAVADLGENGFTVRQTVEVSADATKAWTSLVDVGQWWSPDHTYSHDAANLHLDAKAGGCWCETLPGQGGVQHMTVVFTDPGKMLRLSGGLGPLQALGVQAVMTWTFQTAGKGTAVEMTYAVGGYRREGFKDLAPILDRVLREQIERYQRYVNTGKP